MALLILTLIAALLFASWCQTHWLDCNLPSSHYQLYILLFGCLSLEAGLAARCLHVSYLVFSYATRVWNVVPDEPACLLTFPTLPSFHLHDPIFRDEMSQFFSAMDPDLPVHSWAK